MNLSSVSTSACSAVSLAVEDSTQSLGSTTLVFIPQVHAFSLAGHILTVRSFEMPVMIDGRWWTTGITGAAVLCLPLAHRRVQCTRLYISMSLFLTDK